MVPFLLSYLHLCFVIQWHIERSQGAKLDFEFVIQGFQIFTAVFHLSRNYEQGTYLIDKNLQFQF
jgi:hypothetical protein